MSSSSLDYANVSPTVNANRFAVLVIDQRHAAMGEHKYNKFLAQDVQSNNHQWQRLVVEGPLAVPRFINLLEAMTCVKVQSRNPLRRNEINQTSRLEIIKLKNVCLQSKESDSCKILNAFCEMIKSHNVLFRMKDLIHSVSSLKCIVINSCKLRSDGFVYLINQIGKIGSVRQLLFHNGKNPRVEFQNTLTLEKGQKFLKKARLVGLQRLSLPWPPRESDTHGIKYEKAMNSLTEFLSSCAIEELNLETAKNVQLSEAILYGLKGTNKLTPNFSLEKYKIDHIQCKDYEEYLSRNEYINQAVRKLHLIDCGDPGYLKISSIALLESLSPQQRQSAQSALSHIASAIDTNCEGQEHLLPWVTRRCPSLPLVYASFGQIGSALSCTPGLEKVEGKTFIAQLPIYMENGPFLSSAKHRALTFFAYTLHCVEDEAGREEFLQIPVREFFDLIFENSHEAKRKCIERIGQMTELFLDISVEKQIINWGKELQPTLLDVFLSSSPPRCNNADDIAEVCRRILIDFSKEKKFRELLVDLQDHRYGDKTIKAVNKFDPQRLLHIVKVRYSTPAEQFWVLDHLHRMSTGKKSSYTRRNEVYLFNLFGLGIPLRNDGVRLTKTLKQHNKQLKNLLLEIARDMSANGLVTNNFKAFAKKNIGILYFQRSYYQWGLVVETTTLRELMKILNSQKVPAQAIELNEGQFSIQSGTVAHQPSGEDNLIGTTDKEEMIDDAKEQFQIHDDFLGEETVDEFNREDSGQEASTSQNGRYPDNNIEILEVDDE